MKFPLSFYLFRKYFGASLHTAPYELAGLPATRRTDSDPPLYSNVIDRIEIDRRASAEHLPKDYVAITNNGADLFIILKQGKTTRMVSVLSLF